MKTTRYIFVAALALLAAACQGSIAPEQAQDNVTFTASIDNTTTKTVLGDAETVNGQTHYPVMWYGKEQFSIFDNNNTNQQFVGYSRTGGDGSDPVASSSLTIQGTGDFSDATMTEGVEYYAIHPYHSSNAIAENVITYNAASNHEQLAGTNNMPTNRNGNSLTFMAGKTSNNNFAFKHLMALVKFTITRQDVYRVILVDAGGGALACSVNMTIAFDGENPKVTSDADKTTVYLYSNKAKENNIFFTPGTYYVSVLPCTITPKIRLNSDSYKTGKNAVELKAGMILNLGILE